MRIVSTIILALLCGLAITAAVLLTIDGNLARLTGWYRFEPGMPLFSAENRVRLKNADWMRIEDLNDMIECSKHPDGTWWIETPFRDRLSPQAAHAILAFCASAKMVDTLPLNNSTRRSLREFGVESSPHRITIKEPVANDSKTTIARFTLGSTSPWLADAEDGEHVLPTTYLRTDFYGRDKRIHVVTGNILALFRNGLAGLRDPQPLNIDMEKLRRITLRREGDEELRLQRAAADSDWVITQPFTCAAEQEKLNSLVQQLRTLSAYRVYEVSELKLPEKPELSLALECEGRPEPLRLNFYPPFVSPESGQSLCYATVSDRDVVFALPYSPSSGNGGSYNSIVNAVLSLPVLSEGAMAQIKSGSGTVYVQKMPASLDELRSHCFADLNPKDVDRLSLRSRYADAPLKFLRIPGNADSEVEDMWMYSAEGQRYCKAEPALVQKFISSFKDMPVESFLMDVKAGESMNQAMKRFGLNAADYVLSVLPKTCSLRATLFGCDLPLLKDRAPRTFMMRRIQPKGLGRGYWAGAELGGSSICRLPNKLMSQFSLSCETWKNRNMLSFPLSALRKLTLDFQDAPLELDYDYIGETWSGRLNGEDVSLRINSHRAEYYVRHLQKLKVKYWLPSDDSDALAMLRKPAFLVRLELCLTDYSDAESTVVEGGSENEADSQNTVGLPSLPSLPSGQNSVQDMLEGDSSTGMIMADLATQTRKTHQEFRTIEIVPIDLNNTKTDFYGRIKETGELFVLDFNDAQSLAGSLLEN